MSLLSETLLAASAAAPAAALSGQPHVSLWAWIGFGIVVTTLLVLDMFVFHRRDHAPTLTESTGWTVFWIALALLFNAWIWWWFDWNYAIQFFTGYLVEKSLSMDNVFVFAVIFAYFQVPLKYQYRILFWGVFGAIVMRLAFILLAAGLLERFEWIMYIFGAILLWSGVKLALTGETTVHPEDNPVFKFARRHFRVTAALHGNRFFVREGGKLFVTPLFLVLLVIETTDVLFAVDSVPAIFGVTKVPFIVFTSNVFAIMGLRALYFLLAGVMDMFRYLNYGLSAVLCFIGIKMLAHPWLEDEAGHSRLPHWASLLVIATLLCISIVASLIAGRKEDRQLAEDAHGETEAVPGPLAAVGGNSEPASLVGASASRNGNGNSPEAVHPSHTTT